MKNVALGAIIAMSAAIASNLGVNVQKKSHNYEETKPLHLQRPYTKRPLWWFGMFLIIFGSLGDFFALGFAAQTLVASLGGGSTIFANVVIAHFWLKQEIYMTDVIGVALVTIGVVLLASISSSEGKYTINQIYALMQAPQFILYVFFTVMFVMALYLRVRRSTAPALREMEDEMELQNGSAERTDTDESMDSQQDSVALEEEKTMNSEDESKVGDKKDDAFPSPAGNGAFLTSVEEDTNEVEVALPRLSVVQKDNNGTIRMTREKLVIDANLPLYWAAISGTVGAQSVLLAKCVMELIFESISGENQFRYFGTYVLILSMTLTLLTQTHTLNMACMHGDTMSSFPVFQAFWIGMSNISGIVFFQQAHTFNMTQWLIFPIAFSMVMFGIYLISKHQTYAKKVNYSVAMPLSLGSPRQQKIVAQSFQFTELTPQEQARVTSSSPHDSTIYDKASV